MSISIKLISRKLGFLSSIQPVMFSRKHVLLLHRKCLTSQTQSSYLEKHFNDGRIFRHASLLNKPSEGNEPGRQSEYSCVCQPLKVLLPHSSQYTPLNADFKQPIHLCDLTKTNANVLGQGLRLSAKQCPITSDDIVLWNNYLIYDSNSQGMLSSRQQHTVNAKSNEPNQVNVEPSEPKNVGGKPSDEHLLNVRETLAKTLPNLFITTLDYSIYHQNILFINNLRGTKSEGIIPYYKQISFLRILGHIKYAYVRFEILKITSHPEDNTVRVRWRIRGIKGYMVIWKLLRHRVWRPSELVANHQERWYDGFSTYYVGPNGQVIKHVVDKVMPDDNTVVDKPKDSPLATKLAALCVGLAVSAKDSIMSLNKSRVDESHNL